VLLGRVEVEVLAAAAGVRAGDACLRPLAAELSRHADLATPRAEPERHPIERAVAVDDRAPRSEDPALLGQPLRAHVAAYAASSSVQTVASPTLLSAGASRRAVPAAAGPDGSNASRSSPLRSVNSQPGVPLNWGSGSSPDRRAARSRRAANQPGCLRTAASANRSLHLQLDEAVHLNRVLHRELLGDRLDEPVHDQLG